MRSSEIRAVSRRIPRVMNSIRTVRTAILRTIAWFDVFGHAVNAKEIHQYLFATKSSEKQVRGLLKADPAITSSFGFYSLRSSDTTTVSRIARQYRTEKFWKKIRCYRFIFRLVPFLRFVAVGNTLAFGWPDDDSDIDLFVVAHHRRLFTARFILTLLTSLLGIRRTKTKIAGRFCLSFFAADSALDFQKIAIAKTDPYLAFWVATLIPIWGDDARLVARKNIWIRTYFPNLPWPERRIVADKSKSIMRNFLEWILTGPIGDAIETKLKNWQLQRARKKHTKKEEPTAVVISDKILKFHERDRRREYREQWEQKIKDLQI